MTGFQRGAGGGIGIGDGRGDRGGFTQAALPARRVKHTDEGPVD